MNDILSNTVEGATLGGSLGTAASMLIPGVPAPIAAATGTLLGAAAGLALGIADALDNELFLA